ncbi:hypothetical protein [Kangiella sp.]|uniref:hypothetical protein n=1 Tax=Kangiella sp. TaxID=1920245 RepID=UPI0019A89118|nr:hypothetical protein [Kangiella sp.]MBD3652372.1 hypothetical protein [Kangiella sp.]
MMESDRYHKFLELLKEFQGNKISLNDVEDEFAKLDAFHHFWHYLSDEDWRAKDRDYAKMQNDSLNKFIQALEARDYERAKDITFLAKEE